MSRFVRSTRRWALAAALGLAGALAAAVGSTPAPAGAVVAVGGDCDAFMCGTNHNQVLL